MWLKIYTRDRISFDHYRFEAQAFEISGIRTRLAIKLILSSFFLCDSFSRVPDLVAKTRARVLLNAAESPRKDFLPGFGKKPRFKAANWTSGHAKTELYTRPCQRSTFVTGDTGFYRTEDDSELPFLRRLYGKKASGRVFELMIHSGGRGLAFYISVCNSYDIIVYLFIVFFIFLVRRMARNCWIGGNWLRRFMEDLKIWNAIKNVAWKKYLLKRYYVWKEKYCCAFLYLRIQIFQISNV